MILKVYWVFWRGIINSFIYQKKKKTHRIGPLIANPIRNISQDKGGPGERFRSVPQRVQNWIQTDRVAVCVYHKNLPLFLKVFLKKFQDEFQVWICVPPCDVPGDHASLCKKCVFVSVASSSLREMATRLSLRWLPHQVMPCCIFLVMLLIIWLDLISLTSKIFKSNRCDFIQTLYLTVITTNMYRGLTVCQTLH